MEKILSCYERELAIPSSDMRELAERIPHYLLQFNFIRLDIPGNDGQELIKGALVNGTQSPA